MYIQVISNLNQEKKLLGNKFTGNLKNLNGVYDFCITFLNFSLFWNLNVQEYFLKVSWLGHFKRIKIYDIAYFLVGSREKIDTKCLLQNWNWSFKLDNFLSAS